MILRSSAHSQICRNCVRSSLHQHRRELTEVVADSVPVTSCAGRIVPQDVIDAARRAESEQVEEAVGRGDTRRAPLSDGYLGTFVHHVNIVNGFLERMGEHAAHPRSSTARGGTAGSVGCRLCGARERLALGQRVEHQLLNARIPREDRLLLRHDDPVAHLPLAVAGDEPNGIRAARPGRVASRRPSLPGRSKVVPARARPLPPCCVEGIACLNAAANRLGSTPSCSRRCSSPRRGQEPAVPFPNPSLPLRRHRGSALRLRPASGLRRRTLTLDKP